MYFISYSFAKFSLYIIATNSLLLLATDFKNKAILAPLACITRIFISIFFIYSNATHPSRPGLRSPPPETPPSYSHQQGGGLPSPTSFCQQK